MSLHQQYQQVFERLLEHFGPQDWWPAETLVELCVGAILTQNVTWRNVEKALARLRARDLLTLHAVDAVAEADLAETIRPAGYYNVKARRLKAFARHCFQRYGGDLSRLLAPDRDPDELRAELLSIDGVGFETADSIRVYGTGHNAFIADAYGRRILGRLGLVPDDADYEEVRLQVEEQWTPFAPSSPAPGAANHQYSNSADLWGEFHALLVALGKQYCARTAPQCEECPLAQICVTAV